MSAANFVSHQELFEKFNPQLQCFACKSPPGPKEKKIRYLCFINNHALCLKCKDFCPCESVVCSKPCEFLAKMADIFSQFNCSNYENGCQEVLTEPEYEHHVLNCEYRIVNCPFIDCEEPKTIFKNIRGHLKEILNSVFILPSKFEGDHKFIFEKTTRWRPFFEDFEPFYFYLMHSKTRLFLECRRIPKNSTTLYFWIYILASPEEASKHAYTIHFDRFNHLTVNAIPLDVDFEEIIKNGLALCVDEQVLWDSQETISLSFHYIER